jgi:7-cyano-7-deazaguanine synthase
MNRSRPFPVIVCCGGGIDSTALLHYYLAREFTIHGIHFDYGQPACRGERRAIEAISSYYNVPIELAHLSPVIHANPNGEFYGRNALFVLSALNHLGSNEGLVSLGIHANVPYYDCTRAFGQDLQVLLDGYFGGTVTLDLPFLDFSKADIFAYCKRNNVPIKSTYSCERNPYEPCGLCLSCLERRHYDSSE